MANTDLPFPNSSSRHENGSLFGLTRYGRKKRTVFLLLIIVVGSVLWFNSDLHRLTNNSSDLQQDNIANYIPDDATGVSFDELSKGADAAKSAHETSKIDVGTEGQPLIEENEDEELELNEQKKKDAQNENAAVVSKKPPTTSADNTSGSKTKSNSNNGSSNKLPSAATIELQPQHFKYFLVIATKADHLSRRQIIRQSYFGLTDNMEACLKRDKGLNYLFWIYGEEPKPKTPERRLYEAEKMEWNDLEKVGYDSYDQNAILKWVETTLNERGVTYDYLIIQDSYSLVQLNYIQQQLQAEAGKMWEVSKSVTDLAWLPAQSDKVLIAGKDAVKKAMARENELKDISVQDDENASPSTIMANYYEFYRSISVQMNFITTKKDVDRLKTMLGELPVFVSRDENRFETWTNNVESIPDMTVAVSNIYQDADFTSVAEKLNVGAASLCKTLERPTIAVMTSSFIYPDGCMERSASLAADNKRQYALRHQYAFVSRSTEFAQQEVRDVKRRTVWGKIDAVQKVLPKYEWIFWMDMDAVIMNADQTLQGILDDLRVKYPEGPRAFEKNIDLVIAKPTRDKMINAGVFLLRNTEWAHKFLNAVQASKNWYNKGPSYEQGAMWDIIQLPGYKEKVLLLENDDHTFNTLPKRYIPGDFIVHFAPDKCPGPAVLKGLEAAKRIQQGEMVLTMDDE
ncbi:galactosyl transferase GMA12/MNN10 family-domain-containing protein [Mycotypha africana]|uniref:galactosyl transferase GMA12/MNN10 family-domain-containing protein n=1 Tax=Mycotypha africana TaxID=64632 RepID=UPI002300FD87|nr:galactosyl transferase GMA12/MNN10 family-domain-containing protein [Mycotypha africana]KAI8979816.1 galactosyl transferase GMA12/MNN10 family-domain-containing protein [Mycotypha africana]